ncbi:MAG: hypothetical protein KDH94_05110 [Coxiellaceae bacterium]|nr:hypothetical protein [Coxiellaceae bacterium]
MMVDLAEIRPDTEKALFLAKKQLAELVCDAVNLEGVAYTLYEVEALLDGVAVAGHTLEDEQITLNQAKAWRLLFDLVESDRFALTKKVVLRIHALAGCNESLEWGCFRSGGVTIAGTDYLPPDANELDACWETMAAEASEIENIFDKAIFVFFANGAQSVLL